MKPLAFIMLLLALAGSACGQEIAAIILRDSVGNDVSRSIGLERGPAAAASNSAKLNAAIRDVGDRRYTFSFPAGDWYFGIDTVNSNINGTCIELARSGGQSLAGKGLAPARNEADNNGELPTATRLIYAGPKVSFASTTESLSGTTIAFTAGHDVIDQDVGATVEITGGSGATPGFYVITAVDAGADTWTLDRSAGTSSAITGLMTYTLIRDPGYGTSYKGLLLKGATTIDGTKCHVGIHFVSDTEAPQLDVGKGMLEQMSFTAFNASVLCGRDMRLAYNGTGAEYTGQADDHCDHIVMLFPRWQNCRTGFYMRNLQSVCNDIYHPRFYGDSVPSEVVYAERGGEVKMVSGDFSGADVTALRLARNGSNCGSFTVEDCRFDSQSWNPKWLKMDYDLRDNNQIKFENCRLDEGITTYTLPIWDVKGSTRLIIDNCSWVRVGSIKLTQADGGSGLYWTPHVEVRSSTILSPGPLPDPDEPWQVIHDESATTIGGSGEPMTVTFSGVNTDHQGKTIYPDGRWIVDASGGGGEWAPGWPLPTPE